MSLGWGRARACGVWVVSLAVLGWVLWHWQTHPVLSVCVLESAVEARVEIIKVELPDNVDQPLRIGVRVLDALSSCEPLQGLALRLAWRYGTADSTPVVGQHWRVVVRLKPPVGLHNPRGFDYERWLKANGYSGTGWVEAGWKLPVDDSVVRTLADDLRARVDAELQGMRYANIYGALLLGEGGKLSSTTWQQLRSAGAVHLFVVSGLHVGMVATVAFFFARLLLSPVLCLFPRFPLSHIGAILALFAVAAYAFVVGYGVPVVRASGATLLATLWLLAMRRVSPWWPWWLLVTVVLCSQPLASQLTGTWLSFLAVAMIVLALRYRYTSPTQLRVLRLFARLQLSLFFGMAPWVAWLTQHLALMTIAANAVLVPLIGLLLPILLMIALAAGGGWPTAWLVFVADELGSLLLATLAELSRFDALRLPEQPVLLNLLLLVAGPLLVMPLPRKQRLLLVGLASIVCIPQQKPLPLGEYEVRVLDVGQGSATLVRTRRHTLVFDTGASYPSGFNMADAAVLPNAAAYPWGRLDKLLISHSDNDHSGGLERLRSVFPEAAVYGGAGVDGAARCIDQQWRWDEVSFRLLGPPLSLKVTNSNDTSCMLWVSNGQQSALLTGDTGAQVESLLTRRLPGQVDLLLVPHHGSVSSSSKPLLRKLRPQLALISAGRYNRYGHPHPQVVQRYQRLGARVLSTGECGAMIWRSPTPSAVKSERECLAQKLKKGDLRGARRDGLLGAAQRGAAGDRHR